jgi:RecA-family ATPase
VSFTAVKNHPNKSMPLNARPLESFTIPNGRDPTELIRRRYLCEGGGMLICSYTGQGKSSLEMQMAIGWSLNLSILGIEPARPIRSLIVQAENDDGDITEMRDGVLSGLKISLADYQKNSAGVFVAHSDEKRGGLFIADLEKLLTQHKPNLLWLDPAFAFINGSVSDAKDVSLFLRSQLTPKLLAHRCGSVIVCHMNKPPVDDDKPMTALNLIYAASGSIEWPNWARTSIAVMPEGDHYCLSISQTR